MTPRALDAPERVTAHVDVEATAELLVALTGARREGGQLVMRGDDPLPVTTIVLHRARLTSGPGMRLDRGGPERLRFDVAADDLTVTPLTAAAPDSAPHPWGEVSKALLAWAGRYHVLHGPIPDVEALNEVGRGIGDLEAEVARLRGLLQQANAALVHAGEQAEFGAG